MSVNSARAIALVDVNSSGAILSNNDGCVIALSAELKAMGIKIGVPWFQLKDHADAGSGEWQMGTGQDVLRLASQGYIQPWKMKQEIISSNYTTDWNELPKVK